MIGFGCRPLQLKAAVKKIDKTIGRALIMSSTTQSNGSVDPSCEHRLTENRGDQARNRATVRDSRASNFGRHGSADIDADTES